MFSLSSVQPQVVVPPLATIWNSVRTISHSNAMNRSKGRKSSVAVNTSSEEPIPVTVVQESVEESLRLLGLSEYATKLSVEELNPMLSSTPGTEDHWGSPTVSSSSFYENKNGFSRDQLQEQRGRHGFHTQTFRITLPNLASDLFHNMLAQQSFYQTSRGFKTNRSTTATGFGTSGKDGASRLKDFKDSVFDIMQPGAVAAKEQKQKQSDRLLSLLDHSSPESQEKLKIAFAEGYVAHGAKAETPASIRSLGVRMLKISLTLLMIWFIIQWLLPFPGIGGDIKLSVLKGDKYEIHPEEISVTFADVKGVEEAKQELQDVVQFLKEPEKFRALGAKLPAGVLLVGPPGNGKTLLARAVAGEAGVPFFHASGSEFDEIFVGTGAKRVRQLFEAAKARAPCLVFIDEIDTVGAKRTSSQIHPYANQTINQLLSEMDGFTQNEGVIVLGATNRRDHLDKALLRPGRFDVEVRVFPPDLKGRMEIIKYYLKNIKIGDDIDVEKIARGTTGCSGADLENLVNQSALKAAMDGASKVMMADIEFARDKILMGPAKKTKIQDHETNLYTSYHEAGHALVAYYTKDATPLHKVTIVPRGMTLGHTSFMPEKEQYNHTRSMLLAQMDVSMGGRVGEELTFGADKVTTGAGSDFQGATAIANAMVKQYGMSTKVGVRVFDDSATDTGLSFVSVNSTSPATSEVIDSEIDRLLQESYDRARNVLKTHNSELKALAEALMKYETLDAEEMKTVIQGKKLNKRVQSGTGMTKPLVTPGMGTPPGSGTAKTPL